MIDGAAWLKQLEAEPATAVLLPHDEALALARSLAAVQALMAAPLQRESELQAGRVMAGANARIADVCSQLIG